VVQQPLDPSDQVFRILELRLDQAGPQRRPVTAVRKPQMAMARSASLPGDTWASGYLGLVEEAEGMVRPVPPQEAMPHRSVALR
jgi:hypothetical protein